METLTETNRTEEVLSRRSFLRKAAYTAPAVITLGALTAPSSARASTFTSNTYNADGDVASVETITTQDGTNNVLAGVHDATPSGTSTGDYTLTGAQIKEEVAPPTNDTWTWVDDLFGGSDKWNGL